MTRDRVLVILLILVVILYAIRLYLVNAIGYLAFDIEDLQNETNLLQAKNSELKTQILKERSLGQIETKALRRGFYSCLKCVFVLGRDYE